MAATKGIPIKAFAGQNHDAHIQTKMAYLQDPQNGRILLWLELNHC